MRSLALSAFSASVSFFRRSSFSYAANTALQVRSPPFGTPPELRDIARFLLYLLVLTTPPSITMPTRRPVTVYPCYCSSRTACSSRLSCSSFSVIATGMSERASRSVGRSFRFPLPCSRPIAFSIFICHKPTAAKDGMFCSLEELDRKASPMMPTMSLFKSFLPPCSIGKRVSTSAICCLNDPKAATSKGWVMCDVWDGSWKRTMFSVFASMGCLNICEMFPYARVSSVHAD